jgi:hypothetical protein
LQFGEHEDLAEDDEGFEDGNDDDNYDDNDDNDDNDDPVEKGRGKAKEKMMVTKPKKVGPRARRHVKAPGLPTTIAKLEEVLPQFDAGAYGMQIERNPEEANQIEKLLNSKKVDLIDYLEKEVQVCSIVYAAILREKPPDSTKITNELEARSEALLEWSRKYERTVPQAAPPSPHFSISDSDKPHMHVEVDHEGDVEMFAGGQTGELLVWVFETINEG